MVVNLLNEKGGGNDWHRPSQWICDDYLAHLARVRAILMVNWH